MMDLIENPKLTTVLIVDDTPVNVVLFKKILEKEYNVLVATSGEEAIEVALRQLPDLVLLDVMMGGMDGFSTASAFAANPALANIPIVFVTALTDKESYRKGLSLGAVDFLTKPVDIAILKVRVRNVLDRERLRIDALEAQRKLAVALDDLTDEHNTLNSVFNASNDALLVTDSTLRLIRMNGIAQNMLSLEDMAEVHGHEIHLVLFDDENCSIDPLSLIETNQRTECFLKTPTNARLPISLFVNVFRTVHDSIYYFFSITDISKRFALEEEKRKANLKTLEVLKELELQKKSMDYHSLISITDSNGTITYANDLFCEVSGYSSIELIGNNHRLVKSNIHKPSFYQQLWETISKGQVWNGEIANQKKNGEIYWVESTIVPWLNAEGFPYQYVAIRTNITALRVAEKQLAESRQRELNIASSIQDRLLFGKPPPALQGFNVASHSEPSEGVDGDFYTFTSIGPACFEILVGDVMGKGVTAALIAAGVKEAYRQLHFEMLVKNEAGAVSSPAEIMNEVHRTLTPELISLGSFVTLVLIRFNFISRSMTWVNAGHGPILVARGADAEIEELLGENLPLGILPDEVFEERTSALNIDDVALVFSDGHSEAVNAEGEQFGVENITKLLKQARLQNVGPSVLVNSIRSQAYKFAGDVKMKDDRTAVAVQMRGCRTGVRGLLKDRRQPSSFEIKRSLIALAAVRHRLAESYADQSEAFLGELTLAVFEAATNIVRHTPENLINLPLTLVIRRDDTRAYVSLTYEGVVFDPSQVKEPDFSGESMGGFGIYIIEHMVDEVTYLELMPGIVEIKMIKTLAPLA